MEPLRDVVHRCCRAWFEEALTEAVKGDSEMQRLVGQCYYRGYGVVRDSYKCKYWLRRSGMSESQMRRCCQSLLTSDQEEF